MANATSLLIPGIIGRVLSYLGPLDLASCTRVSQTWFHEAGRHLWDRCGSRFSTHSVPHYRGPGIDCLAGLNVYRMQRYANFIRMLDFDGGNSDRVATRTLDKCTKDVRLLNELTNLQFPRLNSVDLDNFLQSELVHFQSFRQCLVPRLVSFSIRQGLLSDDFFEHVQRNCHRLMVLKLDAPCRSKDTECSNPGNVLENAFTEMILALPSLRAVEGSRQFFEGWASEATLKALAKCQSLFHLEIPQFLHPHSASPISLSYLSGYKFAILERFTYEIYRLESEFHDLGSIFPVLESLDLLVSGKSYSALRYCAQFTGIQSLDLRFSYGEYHEVAGYDLVYLADMLPTLERLCIGYETSAGMPFANDVTDEHMDQMARRLPKLVEFALMTDETDESDLTEQSLLSLGRHCKLLKECTLNFLACFRDLATGAQAGHFASLEVLCTGDNSDAEIWDGTLEDQMKLATDLLRIAPCLTHVFVHEDEDCLFDEAVQAAIRRARRRENLKNLKNPKNLKNLSVSAL